MLKFGPQPQVKGKKVPWVNEKIHNRQWIQTLFYHKLSPSFIIENISTKPSMYTIATPNLPLKDKLA